MLDYIKNFKNSELAMGSLMLVILFNLGNVFSYLFQFSMARMLGPADYGVLAFLMALIYIFTIPSSSIQTVISKYTTQFTVNKNFGKIRGMLNDSLKKLLKISTIAFIAYLLIVIIGYSLFYIKYGRIPGVSISLFSLTGLIIFSSFIYPLGLGILQGMKKFFALGMSSIFANGLRFILAVVFVFLNLKVYGAILGLIFSISIAFILIFPFIKEVLNAKSVKSEIHLFSKGSMPTFFAMLAIVLMYSLDVILIKFFFAPDIVGKYAVLSMIGKIILFGSISVANAMFPISSERFISGNKEQNKLIRKTFITIFTLCLIAVILFAVFPELIIKILFGNQYLTLANSLIYVAIAFSFLSFLNLMVLYRISVERFTNKHAILLFVLLFIQIAILIFARKTVDNFCIGFMISSIISFVGSWYGGRR